MAEIGEILRALGELERRYDGPIPEPLRRIARDGSPERARLIEAEGQARFFSDFVRNQIEAIRRARRSGIVKPHLTNDLALYRRQRAVWRREAARLETLLQARPESVT